MPSKPVEPAATASAPDGSAPALRDLDEQSFARLLEFLASSGVPRSVAYERIRTKLCKFFAWRGAHAADELADETLTRVAIKLTESERYAERPEAFVLGVARMIHLEWTRRQGRWVSFDERTAEPAVVAPHEGRDEWLSALEQCLQKLSASEHSLLLRYHEARGETRGAVRQALADELAIGLSVLRVRMHRMRQQLETCVQARMATK